MIISLTIVIDKSTVILLACSYLKTAYVSFQST